MIYTLILTLSFYHGSGAPTAAIESVPGFSGRESCLSAANAWLEQQNKSRSGVVARALCVQTNPTRATPDNR